MPTSELSGVFLPYWAVFLVAGAVALVIASLIFLVWYYRSFLKQTPIQAQAGLASFGTSAHPDRYAELEGKLETLQGQYDSLVQEHRVLVGRHKTLIGELQRLHHQKDSTQTALPKAKPHLNGHR